MKIRSNRASDLASSGRMNLHRLFGFWPLVLSGMVVLLAAVAFLQYRWTNEASRAEEMRIGVELKSLMMRWHSDLYGEFSAICTAIQVGPDSGARDTWNDYLDRYVEWNYALPHEYQPYVYRNPDLVGEIYIWETSRQPQPRFYWLNLTSRKIEPHQPTPEFSNLLARLQANSASLSTALRAWSPPGTSLQSSGTDTASSAITSGSNTLTGWQFDEDIPAIVHPILHHGAERSLSSSSPVDWMIITLDMNVLRKRVLPELSARYFGGLNGLDYRVALVRTGSHPETIYSSDPGYGIDQLNTADSQMKVFGLPPGPPSRGALQPTLNSRSPQSGEWQSFTAPAWFPVIQYGPSTDSWTLEVHHRRGPWQAVINRVRRNNLAISGLVLLLLGLSIAALTLSGYRVHSFAKLQMDFVASVSHELRTPLTVIFSAGENIKDGVIRGRSDLTEYGSIVTSQSRQLMNHVDRILLFASIRSGRDRYTLRPLAVDYVLSTVRKNLSALLAEESCTLQESIEPGLPPVLADMFAVCGCLENLITNAIKYGGPDRRISLSAHLSKAEAGYQQVAISVEDHGMGIAASELKQIFEPFYRSPQATAAQIHGTGLGLSLAKHLAEAVGGSLTVVSQPGVGSIFTLHLQLAPEQSHTPSTDRSEALTR